MVQQLNVRNVEDVTMTRLTEQAQAEGVTLSEWVRQLLDRAAALLSPAELAARRHELAPHATSADAFAEYYEARLHGRRGEGRRPHPLWLRQLCRWQSMRGPVGIRFLSLACYFSNLHYHGAIRKNGWRSVRKSRLLLPLFSLCGRCGFLGTSP